MLPARTWRRVQIESSAIGAPELERAGWAACGDGQLDPLTPFWQALDRYASSPMEQSIWSRACRDTLLPDSPGDLVVVTARTGPAAGAIAPMVARPGALKRLDHLGVRQLGEPAGFLHSDPAAVEALVTALVELGSPFVLERVFADSPTVRAVTRVAGGRGRAFVRPALPCPQIILSEAWAEPESQLNSGRRSDFRRAVRQAGKHGPIKAEVLSPGPEELPPLLDLALEIEAASWKGRQGSAVQQDPLRGPFFRQYALAASRAGSLRLCFLRLGDVTVAMQFAIECAGAFWLLKIGYRDEYARCSPGNILMAETIRYSLARGLASYQLLGNVSDWTRVWTTDERPCVTLMGYPLRPRALVALGMDALRAARGRLRNRKRAS
jgi:CelD/BcsL family acetyltransferase involved in cellulose biosynthesis